MFNIISKELDFNGNIFDLREKCFKFLNKYEKHYAKEIDSKFDYFQAFDRKKTDFVNKKLNMLPIHKELSKLDSNKTHGL